MRRMSENPVLQSIPHIVPPCHHLSRDYGRTALNCRHLKEQRGMSWEEAGQTDFSHMLPNLGAYALPYPSPHLDGAGVPCMGLSCSGGYQLPGIHFISARPGGLFCCHDHYTGPPFPGASQWSLWAPLPHRRSSGG